MPQVPEGLRGIFEGALGLLPTEVYTRAARSALEGDGGAVAMALLALSVAVGLLHAAGFAIYGRLLDSPQTTGATRTGRMNEVWTRRLPLLSEGASAVALAHLRLAMRTPRGRAVLLTPLLMFGIFSLFMWRGGGVLEFGSMTFKSGISMASFVAAMSLLSILPIAMNQFAIDRAGLTMVLLSPLSVRDYLAGKAAGNAIVTGISTSVVVLVSVLLFPTGSPWTWVSLALGLAATWIAVAPVAAIVSAIFPRAVDLNSVGRGSNAHSAAGLLGMLAFVLAGGPAVALAIVADRVLGRPALGALLILAWMLVAIAVNSVLSRVAERTFEARRENIARLIG